MIQSPAVKWFVVMALLAVAAFFSTGAKRPTTGYVLAVLFAAPAVYVLFRVHPQKAPTANRGSLLGDVDSFLPRVPELTQRFQEWGQTRGLSAASEPRRFLEWVWEHREAIGAEWDAMLPMASAAYGETLRRGDGRAVWRKRGGDAVIEIPGRPWSRTRVAETIHETVFTDI